MHGTVREARLAVLNESDIGQAGGVYVERASTVPFTVLWRRVADGATRVLPDGCTDIIWTGEDLIVAGPDTQAQVAPAVAGRVLTGLRFGPGVGPAVLGVAVHELRDRRVVLDQLWPSADVRRLSDRLAGSLDPSATLERAVGEHMGRPSSVMLAAAAMLGRGDTVDSVATAAGMSGRQLHRRSLDAFGYGPKVLARILRFGTAVALARSGTPLAQVAAICGYSDQAHLTRDVQRLGGLTPTALRR